MSHYTQTKLNRLFVKPGVRRAEPIPAEPRRLFNFQGLRYPVLMCRDQIINVHKEQQRQRVNPAKYEKFVKA